MWQYVIAVSVVPRLYSCYYLRNARASDNINRVGGWGAHSEANKGRAQIRGILTWSRLANMPSFCGHRVFLSFFTLSHSAVRRRYGRVPLVSSPSSLLDVIRVAFIVSDFFFFCFCFTRSLPSVCVLCVRHRCRRRRRRRRRPCRVTTSSWLPTRVYDIIRRQIFCIRRRHPFLAHKK